MAIEEARVEAFTTGVRIPPYRLDECNQNALESALLAPQTSHGDEEKYPDLASKAAALLYALAKSQACPDGNKRVALILVIEFLARNGSTVDLDQDEIADLVLETAQTEASSHDAVVAELTDRLRPTIVPLTTEENNG